jgi:divalent metal cation (Fe/Co/Zn/Cd) transporter
LQFKKGVTGMEEKTQKILLLEFLSIIYNLIEAYLSILFGCFANSIALIGFGLISIVEALYGLVFLWRLNLDEGAATEEKKNQTRKTLNLVLITFYLAGAYLLFESIRRLILQDTAHPSLPGLIIALISMVFTPALLLKKYRSGQSDPKTPFADLSGTYFDLLLPLALFLGLGTNYFFHLWQADPIMGLIIAAVLFYKGIFKR